MNRAQVIAAYRKAAELSRQHGVDVRFYDGWTWRGRDGFNPRAIVEHDTSDPAPLTAERMLQLLANGHGSISGNAITNDAILADATVWVIASGLAWHAGASVWDGLSGLNLWGLGTEYQRHATGVLSDRQLQVGRIWTRARVAAFQIPVRRVCDHAECATPAGRKVDRSLRPGVRMSGATWRTQIAAPLEDEVAQFTEAQAARLRQLVRLLDDDLDPPAGSSWAATLVRDYRARQKQEPSGSLVDTVRQVIAQELPQYELRRK
jgi:hypothetical protein